MSNILSGPKKLKVIHMFVIKAIFDVLFYKGLLLNQSNILIVRSKLHM